MFQSLTYLRVFTKILQGFTDFRCAAKLNLIVFELYPKSYYSCQRTARKYVYM